MTGNKEKQDPQNAFNFNSFYDISREDNAALKHHE